MDRSRKNKLLAIVIVLLILLPFAKQLFVSEEEGIAFDQTLFTVADTASISSVKIHGKSGLIELKKHDEAWIVNKKYQMEPSLRLVLFSVLKNLRAYKMLSGEELDQARDILNNSGDTVSIRFQKKEKLIFITGGRKEVPVSYFKKMGEEKIYAVRIPGYESFVAGIFEISENDWRERVLYNSNWRTIKSISVKYPGLDNAGFKIFDNGLRLVVQGVDNPDSSKIDEYIMHYNYFQVNEYINRGKNAYYDSLSQTSPNISISLDDIDKTWSSKANFYGIKPGNTKMVLGIRENDGQWFLIDQKRMVALAKRKSYFIK